MQDGPGSARVPDQPLVHVEIDSDGRVSVEGQVEPHARRVDRRSLADLAVLAVARDHAGPLGRGVRVVARTPTEHSSMVVHPDGTVSHLEPYLPETPAGVAPAVRAHQWLDSRDADRAQAAAQAAHRAASAPRRRRLLVGTGATVAALVVAAAVASVASSGWPGGESSTQVRTAPASETGRSSAPASADSADSADSAETPDRPAARSVVGATRLSTLAVTDVAAEAAPGALRLAVEATRRTPLTVVVVPITDDGRTAEAARRLELTVRRATTRTVEVADLAAGDYRWVVRAPGQRRLRGVTEVPAVPAPVEVVPVVEDPAPAPAVPSTAPPTAAAPQPPAGSGGGGDGAGDGRRPPEPQATEASTEEPYDPSTAPPTPCDPDDGC